MTTYFVECYWPNVDELRLGEVVDQLERDEQANVAWLSSILIPHDEIVLCLATGPSPEAIRATARRAGLPAERVVACVPISPSRKHHEPSRKDTRCIYHA
jgi:hypothetical protein